MFRILTTIAAISIVAYLAVLGISIAEVDVPRAELRTVQGGVPARGEALFRSYGCNACHAIDGVRGADGRVGPYLGYFGLQSYIAGAVPNRPEQLMAWIMDPQAIEPGTAMPALGVSAEDARHLAAFLYAQR